MSIFDEINARAEKIKAQKRAAYTELPQETWVDFEVERMTLWSPSDGGNHSTIEGESYFMKHILARPTEVLALLAAAGLWSYELPQNYSDSTSIVRLEKYCDWCDEYKSIKEFARDKRFSGGRHYYCDSCRATFRSAKWNRGA